MTFEEWMRHRGLSNSSVKKYEGAITGAMSEWAIEGGVLEGPLTSIQSPAQFDCVCIKLRALPIYQERNERGNNMYSSALNKYAEYLREGFDTDIESDVETILSSKESSITEKACLLKARIGQGVFRQKLIALWGGCAVTGYRDPSMLVASHIKPWSVASGSERLDRYNGLLLLPNLDKAFDSGFISFEESGGILVSPLLESPTSLGVSEGMSICLAPGHQHYMRFHRDQVYRRT